MSRISSLLLGALVLAGLSGSAAATELSPVLPGIELESLDGEKVAIAELAAEGPVLLDFWATWCTPCRRSMPKYQGFAEKYGEAGLRVLTVSQDTRRTQRLIPRALKSIGVSLPVLLDPDEALGRELGVLTLPTSFLVAKGGEIHLAHVGFVDGDEIQMEREIRQLLGLEEEQ